MTHSKSDDKEKWKEWTRWLCEIARAYQREGSAPKDAAEKLRRFVEDADRAKIGGIIITYRRKNGPPKVTERHVNEFAHDISKMLTEHVRYSEEKGTATSALPAGASISTRWVQGFRYTAIDTGNLLDTARTCADALISYFQDHIKRCPESDFPACQGVFLAYKTSQIYCDNNCRQRAFEPQPAKGGTRGTKR